MKQDPRVWVALLGLVMVVFSAAPASALSYAYTPGAGWQTFSTSTEVQAMEVMPAVQYGGMIDSAPGGLYTSFEFVLGSAAILRVTDVDVSGDRYRIFDNNVFKHLTSVSVWQYGEVATDPDVAYAGGGTGGFTLSTTAKPGGIVLGAGSHSLTFQNYAFRNGAASLPYLNSEQYQEAEARAFFRVDPIPEPGTMALLGLGLAFAGLVIRRKR